MWRTYYRLAKPAIVYGNLLTGLAGLLLGVHHAGASSAYSLETLAGFAAGLSLSIAGACVFNNVMDRDIDAKMERTKKRALVTGEVAPREAILYGGVLTAMGLVLLLYTSLLAFLLTLLGIVCYLGAYTPAKRRTPHSTIIGAIAGAVPPVAGYAAATGRLDAIALALFLCLASWQMPHFFVIGLFRAKEYAAAGLPIMPVAHGAKRTRALTIVYIGAFIAACAALGYLASLSTPYFLLLGLLCVGWLLLAIASFYAKSPVRMARRSFRLSLIVLLAWSALIALA